MITSSRYNRQRDARGWEIWAGAPDQFPNALSLSRLSCQSVPLVTLSTGRARPP